MKNQEKTESSKTSIEVSTQLLQDLKLRAEENGRTLEMEFELRLSHSLGRDLQMIQEDSNCAMRAFEVARWMQETTKLFKQNKQ